MFGLGWGEMVVVSIVALIVVGPKDLPVMFRQLGKLTGKARGMAREFSRAMDAAADDAGVKDMKADLQNTVSDKNTGLDQVKAATKSWDQIVPGSETAKLAQERAEAARKIHEATVKKQVAKRAAEAAEAAEAVAPAAKSAAKKAPAKAAATKKAAASKAATKTAAAKTPGAKKPAAKKPAAKKPTAKGQT